MIIPRYRVVITGEKDLRQDPMVIRTALASRFKLKPKTIDRIMLGRPIVVKNNVEAEQAYLYKAEIDSIGVICRIEQMPDKPDTDEHGYIERRKNDRRLNSDRRRHRRENSIQPDRRKGDRRKNSQ